MPERPWRLQCVLYPRRTIDGHSALGLEPDAVSAQPKFAKADEPYLVGLGHNRLRVARQRSSYNQDGWKVFLPTSLHFNAAHVSGAIGDPLLGVSG